ncbi:MAG: acyl-CoA dehydrogenase domain-containing protein [Candidatus Magnetoglobus multicellularis str. Araruama]|uniref:3-methylmercaptopropionyl-CoA dehydrogenase n=1 Tax=Candidatus Magnetoglobus multicellularis str. Araruama TaxID=890399 RepID=A0A1V1PI78_9BACT|nr:MAG: acyl-CoA dehydrogenase domain-containing protein [Candidatus Magnetoglobus multicellularis str. Araruama]
MAQVISDRRDIDFVLYEQLDVEKIANTDSFDNMNRKMIDLLINEARNLAVKEILPTYAEGDKEEVQFEKGEVKVPRCYHRAHKLILEGEWTSLTEDPELGGQGLPNVVSAAAMEYIVGANFAMTAYALLGHGTGKMIELFGNDMLKKLFLKKLYTGQWGGTMLLTEPDAGSDVGALTTTATPNDDGTYSISGNKIFITNGDHDLSENIIHPVLARIEGAPKGTKGISLFIVPKYWVDDNGKVGAHNDVVCTGIEHKMGIKGSATCSLTLGGKGKCRGYLLGDPNKGMKIMFTMMNEARMGVGAQGFYHASCAYQYAVNYARERIQGKELEKTFDPEAPSVAIINHPDVRRMLLNMKAYVDGMRSFIYYVASLFDLEKMGDTEEICTHAKDQVELLIPLIKSYCTDLGYQVCIDAMQVYGGYGYTNEFPVEQLARDCKIASIYEGTNGIQAMDLLARKLGMKKGQVFMGFMQDVQKTTAQAKNHVTLAPLAQSLETALNQLGEAAMHLGTTAMSPKLRTAFAFASPFLRAMGDVIMGWMLLWRANSALPKLEKLCGNKTGDDLNSFFEKNKEASFYDGVIKTASHFILALLPETLGRIEAIKASNDSTINIHEKSFASL